MSETAQQFVAAIMEHDRLADHRAQPRHALAEPCRNPAAMKRQIRAA
jgi:hypothetical protein